MPVQQMGQEMLWYAHNIHYLPWEYSNLIERLAPAFLDGVGGRRGMHVAA